MEPFEQLQEKLAKMWRDIGSTVDDPEQEQRTIVVVPSLTTDMKMTSSTQQAYEERLLFLLYLLRKPQVSMIYVTSQPIKPEIISYYLETIPGIVSSHARRRLSLVSPEDGEPIPLTQKILNRPYLIQHIRSLIDDIDNTHMVPFNTTDIERELAVALGIPMYAADPQFYAFGTKSGARQLFAEERVPHPIGFENLHTIDEIVDAIIEIHAQRPLLKQVVVKLNEGVSGLGNGVVDLKGIPPSSINGEDDFIRQRVKEMQLEASDASLDDYFDQLATGGAIVEEFLSGVEIHSPSAQLRITPLGEVEMLSTHDQMLGGPSGQSYLGAIFPADPAYSWTIMREAAKIGKRLAKEGVVGRFAVDFVVIRGEYSGWETYAIEVNLRKGGTTAPYLILQYLTDGHYDAPAGMFRTAQGQPKYYVASDHVESEAYRAFTPDLLFDLVSTYRLHFNHATQTGIIMHLITGVAEQGRIGFTAIANSPVDAYTLYLRCIETFDREAAKLNQM